MGRDERVIVRPFGLDMKLSGFDSELHMLVLSDGATFCVLSTMAARLAFESMTFGPEGPDQANPSRTPEHVPRTPAAELSVRNQFLRYEEDWFC